MFRIAYNQCLLEGTIILHSILLTLVTGPATCISPEASLETVCRRVSIEPDHKNRGHMSNERTVPTAWLAGSAHPHIVL